MVATEASSDAATTKPCAAVMRTAGHSPSHIVSGIEMYGETGALPRLDVWHAAPVLSSVLVLDVAIAPSSPRMALSASSWLS